MKPVLSAMLVILLTGCATPPQWLANYYDRQDPCQLQNNGGRLPSWCGAGSGTRTYIYDNQGRQIGYTKK